MARPSSGHEHIEAARLVRDSAQTPQQLRQALAVLLPLECGLSLQQTAQVLGRSKGAISTMRNELIAQMGGLKPPHRSKKTLRNRARFTLEQESEALHAVLTEAAQSGLVAVPLLKPLLEARLGAPLSLSNIYNMLARHGWRKLAPDAGKPMRWVKSA